jgi:primosomal protein N' (replication factor Y)
MTQNHFLQIALPLPLRRVFDYRPPRDCTNIDTLQRGIRIMVPFGKQNLVGILLGVSSTTRVPENKLRTAGHILDAQPLLPVSLLELVQWAADYYQYPAGDALLSVLPTLLRDGNNAQTRSETWWRLTTHGKGLPVDALKRSPKQAVLLKRLQQTDMPQHESKLLNLSSAIFRELRNKKLIESYEQEILCDRSSPPDTLLAEAPLTLNEEQQFAVNEINSAKKFVAFLLQGVTGSGKTEVYLQVIENVLKLDKQALILVPEIGLTPQTITRFRKRFNKPVVAFHSGLNNRERLDAWLLASRNTAAIVIGTRSAIFTPIPNLGVIIIDEEHDSSFKQQDNFRYHARDLAIVRAQREKIPIVLGTATPSLETLHNAINDRYQLLRLTQRAGMAKAPRVTLVDISQQKLHQGFADELIDAMRVELDKKNQVLVFLNRRGYAPVLICADCSWTANCEHCNVRLTVHKRDRQLRCHHCGFSSSIPRHCATCHSPRLDLLGIGTQRSEDTLGELFPGTKVMRIDRDSIQRKDALTDILDIVDSGEPAILVGTQMIAKGHHFPNVTLVAILDADGGIFSADFRGAEKLGQLLTQVAGRAGRAEKAGRVLLQSSYCDHPLLQLLTTQSYEVLARQLLAERKTLGLPPYQSQAVLRAETLQPDQGFTFLQHVHRMAHALLPKSNSVQIIGPVPSLMEKRASFFRHELIFSTQHRPSLQQLLHTLALQVEESAEGKKYRWVIDVDPI